MSELDRLAEEFLKFPGIGPRQARRFAHFVVRQTKTAAERLTTAVERARARIMQCPSCNRFAERNGDVCARCADAHRDASLLMVIERDEDADAVERTKQYQGRYVVLGGALPLKPDRNSHVSKEIRKLVSRADKHAEIIIATSATPEGDHTAREIEEALSGSKIKVTRLGRGLSTGSELEYIDEDTFAHALKNRA